MQTQSASQRWDAQVREREATAATLKHWQWYTMGLPHSELFLEIRDFFDQMAPALQQGVQVLLKPDDMSVEVNIQSFSWWPLFSGTKSYTVVCGDSTVVSARVVASRSTKSWLFRMGGYVKLQSGDRERYLCLQRLLLAVMTFSAQHDKLERIMSQDQTVFEENTEQRLEVNTWCMQRFHEDFWTSWA